MWGAHAGVVEVGVVPLGRQKLIGLQCSTSQQVMVQPCHLCMVPDSATGKQVAESSMLASSGTSWPVKMVCEGTGGTMTAF